jgi:hypothetical protein
MPRGGVMHYTTQHNTTHCQAISHQEKSYPIAQPPPPPPPSRDTYKPRLMGHATTQIRHACQRTYNCHRAPNSKLSSAKGYVPATMRKENYGARYAAYVAFHHISMGGYSFTQCYLMSSPQVSHSAERAKCKRWVVLLGSMPWKPTLLSRNVLTSSKTRQLICDH